MGTKPKDIKATITRAQNQPGIANLEKLFGKPLTGWLCPACGKGNAPGAVTCGHCATPSRNEAKSHDRTPAPSR
jgi:uncharacterized OB-fold protein